LLGIPFWILFVFDGVFFGVFPSLSSSHFVAAAHDSDASAAVSILFWDCIAMGALS
jgi:hypothetical protein